MTDNESSLMKRRTFLKGLIAAGAAPMIAPELLASAIVGEATYATNESAAALPKPAPYELWLGDGKRWQMAGMARSVAFEQPPVQIPSVNHWVEYIPGPDRFLSLEVVQDPAGMQVMQECLVRRNIEMLLATGHGTYHSGLVLTDASWRIDDMGIGADARAIMVGE